MFITWETEQLARPGLLRPMWASGHKFRPVPQDLCVVHNNVGTLRESFEWEGHKSRPREKGYGEKSSHERT